MVRAVPILIAALKEQQGTIDSINQVLTQLASTLNQCCSNNSRTINNSNNGSINAQPPPNASAIEVQLSDRDAVVLNQNVPNPFAEQTVISYNIPAKANFAQILFYNINGQLIKAVDIKDKGQGRLNVFANDLSSGTYSYSLYVDGKLMDTKKMTKSE